MVRFKIFFGNVNHYADEKANTWLKEHPDIEVVEMKYQQARYGDHSICIMYKENKKYSYKIGE